MNLPPRIVLMRHGRPAVVLSGRLEAAGLGPLAKAYQASGIVDTPATETSEMVQNFGIIFCSSLPRSRQSARALGVGDRAVADPLFDEARLPYFGGGRVRLSVGLWLTVLRWLWLAGFSRNGESFVAAKLRARLAATRLVECAQTCGDVLLVGHGLLNHLIAQELRAKGWIGPAKLMRDYWSLGVFTPPKGWPYCN